MGSQQAMDRLVEEVKVITANGTVQSLLLEENTETSEHDEFMKDSVIKSVPFVLFP